jgi:NAD+ kinase
MQSLRLQLTLLLGATVCVCHAFVSPPSAPTLLSSSIRIRRKGSLYATVKDNGDNTTTLSQQHQHDNDDDEFTQLSSSVAATKEPSNESSSSSSGALVPAHSIEPTTSSNKRRGLNLMWCGTGEFCRESIRERVVGEDNQFEFDGPATGQVCFVWSDDDDDQCIVDREDTEVEVPEAVASVLFLIKQGDKELLQIAASAIQELTTSGISVHLIPDTAAKIEYKYGVHNKNVKLFEPRTSPGFGGNHVPLDDQWMNEFSQFDGNLNDEEQLSCPVDLICTLGGDGLLMHANVMFQGAVPPILCVAGGSLGFLTPFSRDEMVEAIRVSLGMVVRGNGSDLPGYLCGDEDPVAIKPYDVIRKSDHYYNGGSSHDHHGAANDDDESAPTDVPKFSFGLGNKICLSMRMRLECKVINREGVVRARFNVLNEVSIDRGSSPYLAALECFCDNVHLTTVQADGVIFATPTGSTAYSMAAGGSVVHPAVPAILVTPICPHVLSFRSMIFPDSVVLRCYVPDDARADASVAFDGRYRRVLHRGDSVQIQMSTHPVPTINRVDHSADWLGSLKRNFNFNTRARQRPL